MKKSERFGNTEKTKSNIIGHSRGGFSFFLLYILVFLKSLLLFYYFQCRNSHFKRKIRTGQVLGASYFNVGYPEIRLRWRTTNTWTWRQMEFSTRVQMGVSMPPPQVMILRHFWSHNVGFVKLKPSLLKLRLFFLLMAAHVRAGISAWLTAVCLPVYMFFC